MRKRFDGKLYNQFDLDCAMTRGHDAAENVEPGLAAIPIGTTIRALVADRVRPLCRFAALSGHVG